MLTFKEKLSNYAKLLVKKGVNIQKGQILILTTSIEHKDFALDISREAYREGAKYVHINWQCDEAVRLRYEECEDSYLSFFPEFLVSMFETSDRENAAYLYVKSPDPDLLVGIDPIKISTSSKAAGTALKNHDDYVSASKATWCVAQIPSIKWATKVFPDIAEKEALEKLYDTIFKITKVDTNDPIKEWDKHLEILENRVKHLNNLHIKTMHYKSSTIDLTLTLPKDAIWQGGGENSQKEVYFVANIPTEEVFTVPLRESVNGTVKSTMPLNYRGSLIEDFSLTFEKGKVVSFSAKSGENILKSLLSIDKGSSYLGEVALVPYSSPINSCDIVFYSTLFDENASCHFALGSCYPTNIKNGDKLSDDELLSLGANVSISHEDFMVGSKDLKINVTTYSNESITIFENGEFTL
ncbi:aminopeptidase [Clostridium cylindrosporum]|uniref:Aminopeptidase AmpS n=1 Tax=Clostridium cylindrosporum DSM 605 TaxID=1121307 RepID=A0A0J8FZA2_CLOCY|nr:aminopeptidase [Clostridium cylindrosporum]KMT20941.1 aminopeptidase AmpS [Clostridium cylindrosporum DSM 605]